MADLATRSTAGRSTEACASPSMAHELVGVIDVATNHIETPEEVAATIGEAMKCVTERIVACTNCGMAPMQRGIALAKLTAGQGRRTGTAAVRLIEVPSGSMKPSGFRGDAR